MPFLVIPYRDDLSLAELIEDERTVLRSVIAEAYLLRTSESCSMLVTEVATIYPSTDDPETLNRRSRKGPRMNWPRSHSFICQESWR